MGAHELQQLAEDLKPYLLDSLRRDGFVVIRAEDYVPIQEAKLTALQRKCLRKTAVTFKEIVDAQLLGTVKSKNTIANLIKNKKLKEGTDAYQDKNNKWHVMVSALKRINPNLQ